MSEVVSFKVRRELKRKMEMYRDRVNWADELRMFVENRVRELEALDNFQQVMSELEKASWSTPKGLSWELVREDRDSR